MAVKLTIAKAAYRQMARFNLTIACRDQRRKRMVINKLFDLLPVFDPEMIWNEHLKPP